MKRHQLKTAIKNPNAVEDFKESSDYSSGDSDDASGPDNSQDESISNKGGESPTLRGRMSARRRQT